MFLVFRIRFLQTSISTSFGLLYFRAILIACIDYRYMKSLHLETLETKSKCFCRDISTLTLGGLNEIIYGTVEGEIGILEGPLIRVEGPVTQLICFDVSDRRLAALLYDGSIIFLSSNLEILEKCPSSKSRVNCLLLGIFESLDSSSSRHLCLSYLHRTKKRISCCFLTHKFSQVLPNLRFLPGKIVQLDATSEGHIFALTDEGQCLWSHALAVQIRGGVFLFFDCAGGDVHWESGMERFGWFE